jgi:hypothetical protein
VRVAECESGDRWRGTKGGEGTGGSEFECFGRVRSGGLAAWEGRGGSVGIVELIDARGKGCASNESGLGGLRGGGGKKDGSILEKREGVDIITCGRGWKGEEEKGRSVSKKNRKRNLYL